MDNVTHALAGLLIAESACLISDRKKAVPATSATSMRSVLFVGALTANLPDFDFLYVPITPSPLGYLLHHRGHTHSILIALALGFVCTWLVQWWLRRREELLPRTKTLLWTVGALGSLSHLVMDGWNIYGVHPFWPADNRWFYGDAVFIVEPVLWVTAVPVLLARAQSKAWRITLGLLFALGLALPWVFSGLVPLPFRLFLALAAAGSSVLAWRGSRTVSVSASVVSWSAFVGFVFFAGAHARETVEMNQAGHAVAGAVRERAIDTASSALAANPFCWTTYSIRVVDDDQYVVRKAIVAPFPKLFSVTDCPEMATEQTAPIQPFASKIDAAQAIRWVGMYAAPLAELRHLAATHCSVREMLRFVRVPFWLNDGDDIVVGDMRFDREPGLGFAEMRTPSVVTECPPWIPPWVPPRQDLLE